MSNGWIEDESDESADVTHEGKIRRKAAQSVIAKRKAVAGRAKKAKKSKKSKKSAKKH